MKKAILGTKVGMTQIFDENGVLTPVTVLLAGPCVVTQVKTPETDGYAAIQVGYGDIKESRVNKPRKGHFAKAGAANKRFVRELKLEGEFELGQEIKADMFAAGDKVDATAISKGKGFQGATHRHGLHRGPMAPAPTPAGCSRARRWPVRWATSASPSRIWKLCGWTRKII